MHAESDRNMGGTRRVPGLGARAVAVVPLLVLSGYLVALVAGGLCKASGAAGAADWLWAGVGAAGAAYSLGATIASLVKGRLGVDVIALLALLGALLTGEFLAGAVIAVMLASGRALEGWAAGRARRDLRALLEMSPKTAHRYGVLGLDGLPGELEDVPVEEVKVGDRLMVANGEVVPVDGEILEDAVLDESVLTGEPLPVVRNPGEGARSGAINAGNPFDLLVDAPAAESTYAGIVRMVREAERAQAPMVRLADRYALWFLLLTLAVAGGAWGLGGASRAVAVLVVATPCPLILAAPVAVVSGLSRAARRGVIIKTGGALERLASCRTLLIDKTGTVTLGRPALTALAPSHRYSSREVLGFAASLEQASSHVLAAAVVRAARAQHCALERPEGVEEVSGKGVRGRVGPHEVALGNAAWAGVSNVPSWAHLAQRRATLHNLLTAFVSIDGEPAGLLVFDDPVRSDAAVTIRGLRRAGMERIVMLSGDREEVVESVGAMIGVDAAVGACTPSTKLAAVERERRRAPSVMVGDGINDAPALALADVGVAIGARGATASSEAADVVLVVDSLDRVRDAKLIAQRARRIAVQSAGIGMGLSLVAMGVALAGLLPALWGAVLQEGIDVAAILNALRALRRPTGLLRLSAADLAVTGRFKAEHEVIRADLEQLRLAADAIGHEPPAKAMEQVHRAYGLLVDEVQPHEEAEERELYPAVERIFGDKDRTGTMSRGHAEIALQIRRLGMLLADIGAGGPDDTDASELRRVLYGLYAVLLLHTAQEEENFLSLGEPAPAGRAPG